MIGVNPSSSTSKLSVILVPTVSNPFSKRCGPVSSSPATATKLTPPTPSTGHSSDSKNLSKIGVKTTKNKFIQVKCVRGQNLGKKSVWISLQLTPWLKIQKKPFVQNWANTHIKTCRDLGLMGVIETLYCVPENNL